MIHLKQNKINNCGQTCIAMIAGCDVEVVEAIMGNNGFVDIELMIYACKKLKMSIAKQWKTIGNWYNKLSLLKKIFLPLNCFVHVRFKNNEYSEYGHMLVRKNGKFYNTNGKKYYILPKQYIIKAYLRIFPGK